MPSITALQQWKRRQGWKRRAIGYVVFSGIALLLTALGYRWGMATYEGRPRTFLDSLQFAVEMFTTTGFGGDSPWESPQMNVFITVADLLGMVLLVGALPVFVGPFIERALSSTVPRRLERPLDEHVVICSDTTRAQELIRELDAQDIPYVIVEPDGERATDLYEAGRRVIRADPETTAGLDAASLATARALFVDLSDKIDASIVLTAKELAEEVPVVSVVENPDATTYHRLAGADHVLSPRSVLGESLAAKVMTARQAEVDEAVAIGDQFRIAEISVGHASRLAGSQLADSNIREDTGVTVIGVWVRGEFHPTPSPDMELPAGSVLLVSGRPDQLQQLGEMAHSSLREFRAGTTIIVGYGQVGRAAAGELADAGLSYTVVDRTDMEGVDVVGDATDPEVLAAAGVREAETVIIGLPDDTTTEFTTLVVRDNAPRAQILTRVEETSNISKTYRAGADYVLSLATVTGRMSASYLLEDRDPIALTQQVETVRERVPALAGRTVGDAEIRERTGCTVIAIERDDGVITDVGPDMKIEAEDELVLVGTDEAIRTFERTLK